jgi:hypothetical protein
MLRQALASPQQVWLCVCSQDQIRQDIQSTCVMHRCCMLLHGKQASPTAPLRHQSDLKHCMCAYCQLMQDPDFDPSWGTPASTATTGKRI